MSSEIFEKRFLIWGLVIDQPNIIEKIAGTVRRSPKLFQLVRLYYSLTGEDGKALFYVEIKSNEKNAQRLATIYENYVEILKVWWRELGKEEIYSGMRG
jgi:hypothetical protein